MVDKGYPSGRSAVPFMRLNFGTSTLKVIRAVLEVPEYDFAVVGCLLREDVTLSDEYADINH